MALILIIAMALSLPPDIEVLVLRDGTRIVVEGQVQVKGTKALFRERGGAFYSLDLKEIDVAATKATAAATAAASSTSTPPARTLAVSEEEKRRLLKELSLSRGRPGIRPPASAEAASPTPSPGPVEEPPRRHEDEDAWRARGRAAQAAVDRAKADLADLQRHEDNLEAQLLMLRGYGDHLLTAQLLELERTRYALGVAQRSLEEAQRSLFELQEDARKKDILPGWLR